MREKVTVGGDLHEAAHDQEADLLHTLAVVEQALRSGALRSEDFAYGIQRGRALTDEQPDLGAVQLAGRLDAEAWSIGGDAPSVITGGVIAQSMARYGRTSEVRQ